MLMLATLALSLGGVAHDGREETAHDLVAQRVATIQNLLDAMRKHDQRAFKAVGADKVAFSPVSDDNWITNIGPKTPRLSIDAFDRFASCRADRPRLTGVDWYSVIWYCPDEAGERDAQFSFKFAGRNLIAVQASHLPPRIVRVR